MNSQTAKKLSRRIAASFRIITGIKNRQDAEDCVQSVLLQMLMGYHKKSTIDQAVKDYLKRILGRPGSPTAHRKKMARNYISIDIISQVGTTTFLYRKDIEKALQSMPERIQLCFILYYGFDFTAVEIGKFLGVSNNTVKSYLLRWSK